MTLGLAVTIRDGCILASDGRRTLPLAGNAVASDDVDKLEEVSTTVFAIHFGVAQASAPALAYLKRHLPSACDAQAVGKAVEDAVSHGWHKFSATQSASVLSSNPHMRVALVVGGTLDGMPFFATSLRAEGHVDPPLVIWNKPLQFTAVGGEDHDAQCRFKCKAERGLDGVGWDPSTGPRNLVVDVLLRAAGQVITEVSRLDSTIGGTARYVVIRSGFAVQKAVLDVGAS